MKTVVPDIPSTYLILILSKIYRLCWKTSQKIYLSYWTLPRVKNNAVTTFTVTQKEKFSFGYRVKCVVSKSSTTSTNP